MTIAEAARVSRGVLRPGGIIGIRDADFGSVLYAPMTPTLQRCSNCAYRSGSTTGGDPFLGRHYRRFLLKAGFADVEASASVDSLPIDKGIAPGQPGSRRWFERFGDALVCVRYRVDAEAGRRLVTVELQVDAAPLRPRNDDQAVLVRIEWRETELRELARQHGARWDSTARAWRTTRAIARKLRWVDRIVTVAE